MSSTARTGRRAPNRNTPAVLLAFSALAFGCTSDPLGAKIDASTSPPAEVAAGLFASIEVERIGRAGTTDTLSARATVENRSAAPIAIVHGACSLELHGWAAGTAAEPGAPPLWRSEKRQPWEGTSRYGCILIAYTAVIQPGQRYSHPGLTARFPVIELLGDSLPDGRYDVAGIISLAVDHGADGPEERRPLRTGATTLELTLLRPPLQEQRTFDLVTWSARPARVEGDIVEARVDGELTHAGGMLLELSADCALRLHAYATRAQRDAAPRSGPAAVSRPAACRDEFRRVTLRGGETESLTLRVPVADILAAGAAGTVYFAVSVHTRHGQVWLNAGSAAVN